MMDFAFKMMDFVFKMMNFERQTLTKARDSHRFSLFMSVVHCFFTVCPLFSTVFHCFLTVFSLFMSVFHCFLTVCPLFSTVFHCFLTVFSLFMSVSHCFFTVFHCFLTVIHRFSGTGLSTLMGEGAGMFFGETVGNLVENTFGLGENLTDATLGVVGTGVTLLLAPCTLLLAPCRCRIVSSRLLACAKPRVMATQTSSFHPS